MKITDHSKGVYRIYPNLIKENRRMPTCNRLDLQTLGSQPVMPKILPDLCNRYEVTIECNLWKWHSQTMCLENWVTSNVLTDFINVTLIKDVSTEYKEVQQVRQSTRSSNVETFITQVKKVNKKHFWSSLKSSDYLPLFYSITYLVLAMVLGIHSQ